MVLSWKTKGVEYSLEASGSTSSGFERASASRAIISFCKPRRKESRVSQKRSGDIVYSTNLDLGQLWRVPPFLTPITSSHSLRRSSTDGVEHKLSRVGVVRAGSSVPLEVRSEYVRVLSDVSEVDSLRESERKKSSTREEGRKIELDAAYLSTLLEQKKPIEVLEKKSVGLMNSAENRLTLKMRTERKRRGGQLASFLGPWRRYVDSRLQRAS